MAFDSQNFISKISDAGMHREQAVLLAQTYAHFMSMQTLTSEETTRLEDRVRAERDLLEGRLMANHAALGLSLHKELEAQSMINRTQVDGIQSRMGQLEARIEGSYKTNLAAMKSNANKHSAANMMLVLSAMAGVYFIGAA